MHITVQEVLQRYPATLGKVVAGFGGLQRLVGQVGIMDAPDILDWVKPGEFLITTGYALGNDIEAFERLIEGLAKVNCAALGLKTKRFWQEFPESVIDLANRLNFPLIEVPATVSLADIAVVIQTSQREWVDLHYLGGPLSVQEFLTKLISGHLSPAQTRYWTQRFGLDPASGVLAGEIRLKSSVTDWGLETWLHRVSQSLAAQTLFKRDGADSLSCLFAFRQTPSIGQVARTVSDLIEPGWDVRVFLGTVENTLFEYPTSFQLALVTERVAALARPHQPVVWYDDVAVYATLEHRLSADDLEHVIARTIGPLLRYDEEHDVDWTRTLATYLATGKNAALAAMKLNTHKNTVTYRINKIQEVLQADLSQSHTVFELYLGLMCHNLRDAARRPRSATAHS